MATALLRRLNADAAIPLIVGGLFVNHCSPRPACSGWSESSGKERLQDWSVLAGASELDPRPCHVRPPSPASRRFRASGRSRHWVMNSAAGGYLPVDCDRGARLTARSGLSVPIVQQRHSFLGETGDLQRPPSELLPVFMVALLLDVGGYFEAILASCRRLDILPLGTGAVLYSERTGRADQRHARFSFSC